MKVRSLFPIAVGFFLIQSSAFGYFLESSFWTLNRTVEMQLSLGGAHPLIDGFGSFNESAEDALNVWSPYLAHLSFRAISPSPVPAAENDYEMSALFSNTVFGDSFGNGTLAVTLISFRGKITAETDTVFNTAYIWDSYRGVLRPGLTDFHRVAIHEFGHTLGLDHPDQHGQHVSAIMNAFISNIDTVQPDDIAGVESIYSTGPAYQVSNDASVLLNLSTRSWIGTGQDVLIGGFIIQGSQSATVILRAVGYSLRALGVIGAISDPTITVYDVNQNVVATNDDWFTSPSSLAISSYHLDPSNSIESAVYLTLNPGAYTVVVQGFFDATTPQATGIGLVEIYDLHKTASRAGNISTRGLVQGGNNVLIAGFIIGGAQTKEIIVRALGPSLTGSGITSPLSDPTLDLVDANGTVLVANDDWQLGGNAQTITDDGLAPKNPKESAVYAILNPGNYTAIVRGVNNVSGLALVEVYDLSPPPP